MLDDAPELTIDLCLRCGSEMEWVDCPECAGEGGFEGYELMELDPLWYGPDDYEPCSLCGGRGGWLQCFNTHEGTPDAP